MNYTGFSTWRHWNRLHSTQLDSCLDHSSNFTLRTEFANWSLLRDEYGTISCWSIRKRSTNLWQDCKNLDVEICYAWCTTSLVPFLPDACVRGRNWGNVCLNESYCRLFICNVWVRLTSTMLRWGFLMWIWIYLNKCILRDWFCDRECHSTVYSLILGI